jgi:hypothetical protein
VFSCPVAAVVRSVLKEVTLAAKHFGDLLLPEWKKLVDLHTMCDYLPSVDDSEFVDDIRDWVGVEREHECREGDFMDLFSTGADAFLTASPGHEPFIALQPDQFLADPGYWARSGVSDGERLFVLDKGKVRRMRKSKWATALAADLPYLRRLFYDESPQRNKAIQKRERGKVRAIIAGDLSTYLQMKFVSYWLNAMMQGHPNTTLFYNAEQLFMLYTKMAQDTETKKAKMPIDQDEFDHQVRLKMVLCILQRLHAFVATHATAMRADLLATIDRLTLKLSKGTVLVAGVLIQIINGILSGWEWTALLDTIVNAAENYACRVVAERRTGRDPLESGVFQGDDGRLVCPNETCAVALWGAYTEMGFKVNPAKFWIARNRDEFLRQVATPGETSGYPARAVPSAVYRSPVTRNELPGEERFREGLSTWNTIAARLGTNLSPDAFIDMARANSAKEGNGSGQRVTVQDVDKLAHTPACMGGLGYYPWDGRVEGLAMQKSRAVYNWKWLRLPPLARTLADAFGVSADAIARLWRGTVEAPPQAEVEYQDYHLVNVKIPQMQYKRVPFDSEVPLQARARPDLPPSVAAAKLDEILRTKDWTAVVDWLHPDLYTLWDRLWKHTSRRVAIAWLADELPFSSPIVPGVSTLVSGLMSSVLARSLAASLFTRPKTNYGNVMAAAMQAEFLTHELCATLPVVLGG